MSCESQNLKSSSRTIMLYSQDNQHVLQGIGSDECDMTDLDILKSSNDNKSPILQKRGTFNLKLPSGGHRNVDFFSSGSLNASIESTTSEAVAANEGLKRINSCFASRSACQGLLAGREMPLPELLQYDYHLLQEYDSSGEELCDFEELCKILPFIASEKMVSIEPQVLQGDESMETYHPILRIGLVLSGGPAPGGHNVIAGVFDYLKLRNSQSQLIGFLGGIDGFLTQRHEVVSESKMAQFRNMGGFNMLWSGRGKVNGPEDLEKAKKCVDELQLDGLIIIGGDGSNSNAAILANHLAKAYHCDKTLKKQCCVIGVPKTVDGDVKSKNIELSFGFDTAARTYSELIGNLCIDASSTSYTYYFIRVMGRSASHLALECGMQTRPNIVLIGEEVEAEQQPLCKIVDHIVDVMEKRSKLNKTYGVVLIPEGLIEFIPEIRTLIEELNGIIKKLGTVTNLDPNLLKKSRETWEFLPESIREQLLMDREATGYIMLAKIATERLLVMLVESRIRVRKLEHLSTLNFMTHYFGYEGRCAIPSDFDACYCYALGYNAAVLVNSRRNGYMSVIRNLKAPAEEWVPIGLPFLHVMDVRRNGNVKYPAIRKTLLDLKGDLFKTFTEVRELWAYQDLYRCPGPIQLYSTNENHCFSISCPTKGTLTISDLKMLPQEGEKSRFLLHKHLDCLSDLQRDRLGIVPKIPALCTNSKAFMRKFKSVSNADQYTASQIMVNYPYLTNTCGSYLFEVFADTSFSIESQSVHENMNLKVGIVMLSKQAPGALNVIWGLYQRIKLVGGVVYAFHGGKGLLERNFIELKESDFDLFRNQGGLEMVHRSRRSVMYYAKNWRLTLETCKAMNLDGLVIMGDEGAMTQASLLSEFFLSCGSRTSIIGVPVAGSNGLAGPLIEACVGFDSNARIYASLVGNVLTDAVSMPKYWHFVKILGRYPSIEVLECALQTHPNLIIIAEEYGAQDKTLNDVVQDIADAVVKRANMGKNFGTVLIPDHLVLHLPNTRNMLAELRTIISEAKAAGERQKAIDQLMNYESDATAQWVAKMTPWSLAVFGSLPNYIRKELLNSDATEVALERLEIEIMLSKMVKQELIARKAKGLYNGNYAAVTHYFGYQGRCCMPSEFDCSLAYAYGHLAGIAVESGLTGLCCSIRGLCGPVQDWKLYGIPLTVLMKLGNEDISLLPSETHTTPHYTVNDRLEVPVIPSCTVSMKSKAFKKLQLARKLWLVDDLFVNPGPIQFDSTVGTQSLVLINEHAEYYHMLNSVEHFATILKNTCKFGVSEEFLHHVFIQLWGLIKVVQSPEDLLQLAKSIHGIKIFDY